MSFLFLISLSLIFWVFIFDLEFFYLASPFIVFHILKGLTAIVKDYIYFKILSIFFYFCIRVSVLEVLRYFLDFLL